MNSWLKYGLLLLVCCSLGAGMIIPVFDDKSILEQMLQAKSQIIEPVHDPVNSTYPAFYAAPTPPNLIGIPTPNIVNYSHFWKLFKQHTAWQLEAYNPQTGLWVDEWQGTNLNQWLNLSKVRAADNNSEKITLTVTNNAPIATRFRFKFGIDLRVKNFVNKSNNYEYVLTYPANATENYSIVFNWSDVKPHIQAGNISVKKGIKNIAGRDIFYCIFEGLKNLGVGQSFELDPYFGYHITDPDAVVTLENQYDSVKGIYYGPSGTEVDSIWLYLADPASPEYVMGALYLQNTTGVNHTLVTNGETEKKECDGGGWFEFNFTGTKPTVDWGNTYYVGGISNGTISISYSYNNEVGGNGGLYYEGMTAWTMENPIDDMDTKSTGNTVLAYAQCGETIGYWGGSTSYVSTANDIRGTVFTSPSEAVTITSMSCLIRDNNAGNMSMAIYENSSGNLIAHTDIFTYAGNAYDQWRTTNITYGGSLSASTDYYFCMLNGGGGIRFYYNSYANWSRYNTSPGTPTVPNNVWNNTNPFIEVGNVSRTYCIYATYTETVADGPTAQNIFTGYITFGNQSRAKNIYTGYVTFGNESIVPHQVTSGWVTFGNESIVPHNVLTGWITFGNQSQPRNIYTGWVTFGNETILPRNILTGWVTFGNESITPQQMLQGYVTFGNQSSPRNVFTGWVTFGNVSGANRSTIVDGYVTFGNESITPQNIFTGYITFGNESITPQQILTGYITFGNITSNRTQILTGWVTFGNITAILINITSPYPANQSTLETPQPTLRFTLTHTAGSQMNYSIYLNNSLITTVNNVANGTYYYVNYFNATTYDVTYYWKVTANTVNDIDTVLEIFEFTLEETTIYVTSSRAYWMLLVIAAGGLLLIIFRKRIKHYLNKENKKNKSEL